MITESELLKQSIVSLNAGATSFVKELDQWIRKYPAIASSKQVRRADVLQSALRLRRIGDALQWGPSVALYGESQCGKSNLVSRFAHGLGAAASPEGDLLVRDPSGGQRSADTSFPWDADDAPGKGVNFMRWIDPGAGKESTGVVCRFTRRAPSTCKTGCFRVEFMTHSELLCSLAMGFNAQIADSGSDERRERIARTLGDLRKAEPELDADGRMGDLFEAWDFLKRMLHSTPLMSDLDHSAGGGWDEFVEECLRKGVRPRMEGEFDSPSDLERLVSLLWDCNKSMTIVWRILYADLMSLRGIEECCIAAVDVCKDRPTGGRNSLVAVDEIDRLKQESLDTCVVYGRRPGQKSVVEVPISRASIVALAREFILPVGDADGIGPFDVLDYPGARAEQQHSKADDKKSLEAGKAALLRGKINRLFLSGVDHYDATVLCLVVQAGGNLEAGKPVRRCLEHWLRREGWSGAAPDEGEEPSAQLGGAPLLVAVSKSDLLVDNWLKAQNRLEAIRKEYSAPEFNFDWMRNWDGGRPFTNVFWVHNPNVKHGSSSGPRLFELDDARKREFIDGCSRSKVLAMHSEDLRARMSAMFDEKPSDVDGLLDSIRSHADAAGWRRVPALASRILDEMRAAIASVNAGFMGRASKQAVDRAQADALEHIAALSELSIPAIASLLDGLTVSSQNVLDAWKRSRDRAAREEPDSSGGVPFDCFYEELIAIFSHEYKRKAAGARWQHEVSKRSKDLAASIETKLAQLPSSGWFRDAIERQAGPLLEQDTMGIRRARLLLVVSAQWNRCMVWLAPEPPPSQEPVPAAPTLRGRKGSHRTVIQHWQSALPDAYRMLVDGRSLAQPYNIELGELRDSAARVLVAFRSAVPQDPGLSNVLSETESLLAQVTDPAPEVAA
jgi:hypothetical protein